MGLFFNISQYIFIIVSGLILISFSLFAQFNEGVERVNYYQLNANYGILKEIKEPRFNLRYYVLPKEYFTIQSRQVPEELVDLMINDEGNLRWFFHPKDEFYHFKIKKFLSEKGLNSNSYELEIKAQMTESRSSFLQTLGADKKNYSIRMSYTNGIGRWSGNQAGYYDKGIKTKDANWAQFLSDRITNKTENLEVQKEAATFSTNFGKKNADIAFSLRDINQFSHKSKRYMPSYISYHDKYMSILSTLNGNLKGASYWAKLEGKTKALATVDMLLDNKLVMTSVHSQNFLHEFTSDYRPTYKILTRDIGDSFIPEGLFDTYEKKDLQKIKASYPHKVGMNEAYAGIGKTKIPIPFTWTHGSQGTLYNIDVDEQKVFKETFVETFLEEMSKRTQISLEEIKSISSTQSVSNVVYNIVLDADTKTWKKITKMVKDNELYSSTGNLSISQNVQLDSHLKNDLINHLETGVDVESSRLKYYENLYFEMSNSKSKKITEQALVTLGTENEAILASHLSGKGSFYTHAKALDTLSNLRNINVKTQLVLTKISSLNRGANKANLALSTMSDSILLKLKPRDKNVIKSLFKGLRGKVSQDFYEIIKHINKLPDDYINESLDLLRANTLKEYYPVKFNEDYRNKVLALDPRTWSFFQKEWVTLSKHRENQAYIKEADVFINQLQKTRLKDCNFLIGF